MILFLVSLPAVTARLYSSDEVQYYSYLRSLWFDRDVSFQNEYQYFYDHGIAQSAGFHETFLERQTEAGRRINFATVGGAVLWAPFYGMADASVRAIGRGQIAADGFSQPYIASVAYASAFYGFVAVLLSIRAARILTGGGLPAGLAVWFGTPLLFYMYVAPPMSHATSAFGVALFVTAWLHARETWSAPRVALLGVSAALMGMVREQDVFFAVGPIADFLLAAVESGRHGRQDAGDNRRHGIRRWVAAGAAGLAAFAAGYIPQVLAYDALNGRTVTALGLHVPGPSALVSRKMTWTAPHSIQVLLSPEHGFLFWTPLAALGITGLAVLATRRADRRARRIGGCMLLMVAAQVYISGSVESWTVAGAFGQRRFVALTVLLTIGLAGLKTGTAAFFQSARWKTAGVAVLAAVAVWWNLALMAEFGTGLMDRQRIELRRNAYDAFVTLPRMAPSLLWRYLTARESFYRPDRAEP